MLFGSQHSARGDYFVGIMIDYLQFYVSLKNFSLIWRSHQTVKGPMLGAQGL
jgi:hypothetical protein